MRPPTNPNPQSAVTRARLQIGNLRLIPRILPRDCPDIAQTASPSTCGSPQAQVDNAVTVILFQALFLAFLRTRLSISASLVTR